MNDRAPAPSGRHSTDSALPAMQALWPNGSRRLTRRPGRSPALLVLPSRRSPRMLVPTGTAGAAAMLWRHSKSRRQRLGQAVLARSVRSGLLPLLPVWRLVPTRGHGSDSPGSIEEQIRVHVPSAASLGVLLGPVRANAKPVLRIFDTSGRTIAFGKVGHNELSAALVRREAEVLGELSGAPFTSFELPSVLFAGRWGESELLLMTPLGATDSPAGSHAPPSWELPLAAMVALAEHGGTVESVISASPFRGRLGERIDAAPTETAMRLSVLVQRVDRHSGARALGFGRWHGDWAPWNMGVPTAVGGSVQVWDWERSETGVPLGFDVVHFLLQREFFRRTAGAEMADVLVESGSQALARWCPKREHVEATILLYLVEILARYATDGGPSPTPQLQSRIATIEGVFEAVIADRSGRSHAIA